MYTYLRRYVHLIKTARLSVHYLQFITPRPAQLPMQFVFAAFTPRLPLPSVMSTSESVHYIWDNHCFTPFQLFSSVLSIYALSTMYRTFYGIY